MIKIFHIIEKLIEYKQLTVEVENLYEFDKVINGIKSVISACDGDLSWISEERTEVFTNWREEYLGSCLIVPSFEHTNLVHNTRVVFLPVKSPKLAFSLIANDFFLKNREISTKKNNVIIDSTSFVDPSALLEPFVVIGPECYVGKDVKIGANTVLRATSIGSNSEIGANCSIGGVGFGFSKNENGTWIRFPHVGEVIIGNDVSIGSNTCIDRGALGSTTIGTGSKIDNLVHISHNVQIGKRVMIIANSCIGGSARINDDTWVSPSASILNQLEIGTGSMIGLGAVVIRDVAAGARVVGNPARPIKNKGIAE